MSITPAWETGIPAWVLDALRQAGYSDEAIKAMTPRELFGHYCEWEGILGYSDILWNTVMQLRLMK